MNHLFLLFVVASESALTDSRHMDRCFVSVRNFFEFQDVSWLLEKADTDTVLLFLLRVCYFQHPRDGSYSLNPESVRKPNIPSFEKYHFQLIDKTILKEAKNNLLKNPIRPNHILDDIDDVNQSDVWPICVAAIAMSIALLIRRFNS